MTDAWVDRGGALPFDPQPKVIRQRGPYKTLQRGGFLKRTTLLAAKRNTRPYGGASVEFPKRGDFQRFIRERDGVCVLCGLRCGPLQVAHLIYKVSMGGRKKVSVNQPWNACLLGDGAFTSCHEIQEHSKAITVLLVTRLMAKYHYAPPAEALAHLAWQCALHNRDVDNIDGFADRSRDEVKLLTVDTASEATEVKP